jgi:hypothetical protein
MCEERERSHRNIAVDPDGARDPILLVRRPPFMESDTGGPPLERQRLAGVEGPRRELQRPLLQRQLPHLCELAADDSLGGLVVEDEPPALVGDQRRRREVRGKLSRQDEDEVLRSNRGD